MSAQAIGQRFQAQQQYQPQQQHGQAQVAGFAPQYESSYEPASSGNNNNVNAKNFFQQNKERVIGGAGVGTLGLISAASSGGFSFITGAAAGGAVGLSAAMHTNQSKKNAMLFAAGGALAFGVMGIATHGMLPALITIGASAYAGQHLGGQYQSGALQQFIKS